MNLVWKQPASAPSAGMMHCTSTIMASTAPVATASSCCRKLPATGTPWRMRTSFPVQHIPATLMPTAPCFLARSTISGSAAAATIISESSGSWPCTMMLTLLDSRTPRLASEKVGVGVPKRTSCSSVAIIEPPQPSAMLARRPCRMRLTGSLSTPIWVRCMISTISRSMPRGSMPSFSHSSTLLAGARRVN